MFLKIPSLQVCKKSCDNHEPFKMTRLLTYLNANYRTLTVISIFIEKFEKVYNRHLGDSYSNKC